MYCSVLLSQIKNLENGTNATLTKVHLKQMLIYLTTKPGNALLP